MKYENKQMNKHFCTISANLNFKGFFYLFLMYLSLILKMINGFPVQQNYVPLILNQNK